MQNKLRHLGVILDGNRRWAKQRNLNPWEGYKKGAENLANFLEWCKELKIKELTLYAFSLKNFERDKAEVKFLFQLFELWFLKILKEKRIDEDKVRVRFIGRIKLFPKEIYELMKKIMEKTKNYNNYRLNFCMAYDGRAEIVDAVNKILKSKVNKIEEKDFSKNLYLDSEPDLIIRTSGEKRISGFLPWQSSYSEFYFTEKHWPEFSKQDLIKAIEDFESRERRFGK